MFYKKDGQDNIAGIDLNVPLGLTDVDMIQFKIPSFVRLPSVTSSGDIPSE